MKINDLIEIDIKNNKFLGKVISIDSSNYAFYPIKVLVHKSFFLGTNVLNSSQLKKTFAFSKIKTISTSECLQHSFYLINEKEAVKILH